MPSPALSPDALRAVLRAALQRLENGSAIHSDGQLGDALITLSAEAKRHSLRAEQVLVLLKQAWRELPEARALTDGEARQALLSRVIVLCLDEYYGATD